MATERTPKKHVQHPTVIKDFNDGRGPRNIRVGSVHSAWKKQCFVTRIIELDDGKGNKVTTRKLVPNRETHVSLRAYVRSLLMEQDLTLAARARDWFFNKRANTSNPPKGIGRTNRVNGGKK